MTTQHRIAVGFCIASVCAAPRPSSAQVTVRVSVSNAGFGANGPSYVGGISDDGQIVVFSSRSTNLDPRDPIPSEANVYVHDRRTGTTSILVGNTLDGRTFKGDWGPFVSADGRYVSCLGHQLGTATGTVLFFDRFTGQATDVYQTASGTRPNGGSLGFSPSLSANGRYVVFSSNTTDLIPGIPSTTEDRMFVYDVQTGQTTLDSIDENGRVVKAFSDGGSQPITSDGRFLLFNERAANGNALRVLLRDRAARQTTVASIDSLGLIASGETGSISDSGRFVAFSTSAPLTGGGTGSLVFVRDLQTQTTTPVSVTPSGLAADAPCQSASISSNGRFVAFHSFATNLVPGDTNGANDVFLRDLTTGVTTRISVDYLGREANGLSGIGGLDSGPTRAVSNDGRFVVFDSSASNLVTTDRNGLPDVYVRDTAPCQAGTVNANAGAVASVLFVNLSTGEVVVPVASPIRIDLVAAPAGPTPARYGLFIWRGLPNNQFDVVLGGQRIGCTVNPTAANLGTRPQPYLCLRGGFSPRFCTGTREVPGPALAPWTLTNPGGFSRRVIFTLQGILEDNSALNRERFSVTNSVELIVR
ncbi:MAG: hypothetical protein HYR85_26235 [Planctomycetes bacterium]|nr:hypothetical protein [Planctomycetota bacterium]MBI3848232.1 hypothetical protein [Planctomycetota bacterium]